MGSYTRRAKTRVCVGIATVMACALLTVTAAPTGARPVSSSSRGTANPPQVVAKSPFDIVAHAGGKFRKRASSPKPFNNVVFDPTTKMIYAQEFEGKGFYRYDPKTNKWTKLAKVPIKQANNGGAAYLKGKIYTVYSDNDSQMGVYNVATGKWKTIANPLMSGTGNITAAGGLLYLAVDFTFISYNPQTHVATPLASPPFDFTSWGGLAPYKGNIYGMQGDGDTGFAVYHIAKDKWNALDDVPGGAVLGEAIDPVKGIVYGYGSYEDDLFYRYDIAHHHWLFTLAFPYHDINDGGLAYVPTKGLQGIYATYGQNNPGFTRYVAR